MKLPRSLLAVVVLAAAAFLAPVLRAQPSHVKASLVSADATVQPGHAFTVALRFVHDPHWHTYWVNPGTGLPTSLAWKLPPGWKASDILWPAPHAITDKAQSERQQHGNECRKKN